MVGMRKQTAFYKARRWTSVGCFIIRDRNNRLHAQGDRVLMIVV